MNRSIYVAVVLLLGVSACTRSKVKEVPTIHSYSDARIETLDPADLGDNFSAKQAATVYEPLLQYDFFSEKYELIPALAEDLPDVLEGGRVYVFRIKKGVLFQDDPCFEKSAGRGRELVAEDFAYSFKRLMDPKKPRAASWILANKVEEIRALDRFTLEIRLKEPLPHFPLYLAMPQLSAVPKEAVEYYGDEFGRHPVGTGPYRLNHEESDLGSRLIWEVNPTFRVEKFRGPGGDQGKRLPLVPRVIVKVFPVSQSRWLSFMQGGIDFTLIPKDYFEKAITPAKTLSPELVEKGIRLSVVQMLDLTGIVFNLRDPVLKRKRIRQALSLAYDSEAYIDLFFNGRGLPAQGPIPPGLDGYDANWANPNRRLDLVKAKELLAKAGHPNGAGLPVIKYAATEGGRGRQAGEFVKRQLSRIGVKVELEQASWAEHSQKMKEGRGQLFGYAWVADYPDAENFMQLFYGPSASPGPNTSNYQNPKVDRLIEKAAKARSAKDRTKLYREISKILAEDCPWIWVAHRQRYFLSQARLKNFRDHLFVLSPYKYFGVAQP